MISKYLTIQKRKWEIGMIKLLRYINLIIVSVLTGMYLFGPHKYQNTAFIILFVLNLICLASTYISKRRK